MRLSKRLLVTGAASALLVGGSLGIASSASAASAEHGSSHGKVHTMETWVETWEAANIRNEPTTNSGIDRSVGANTSLEANCWLYGQEVTEGDTTNNVWLELDTANPFDDEYIWAGAIRGDKYGGVQDQC